MLIALIGCLFVQAEGSSPARWRVSGCPQRGACNCPALRLAPFPQIILAHNASHTVSQGQWAQWIWAYMVIAGTVSQDLCSQSGPVRWVRACTLIQGLYSESGSVGPMNLGQYGQGCTVSQDMYSEWGYVQWVRACTVSQGLYCESGPVLWVRACTVSQGLYSESMSVSDFMQLKREITCYENTCIVSPQLQLFRALSPPEETSHPSSEWLGSSSRIEAATM